MAISETVMSAPRSCKCAESGKLPTVVKGAT